MAEAREQAGSAIGAPHATGSMNEVADEGRKAGSPLATTCPASHPLDSPPTRQDDGKNFRLRCVMVCVSLSSGPTLSGSEIGRSDRSPGDRRSF